MFMPDCPSVWLYESLMLLPNAGRKIADWPLRSFTQCANIQVLNIYRVIDEFLQKWYNDIIRKPPEFLFSVIRPPE